MNNDQKLRIEFEENLFSYTRSADRERMFAKNEKNQYTARDLQNFWKMWRLTRLDLQRSQKKCERIKAANELLRKPRDYTLAAMEEVKQWASHCTHLEAVRNINCTEVLDYIEYREK